jgi:mannan endo-1,4-beta-mannosidase
MRIVLKATFVFAVLCSTCLVVAQSTSRAVKVSGLVTRSGSRLMLNGKPFRFAGANLDNLNLASNRYSLIVSITGKIDAYYPSHWAIDDAFETLRRMGGTVARVYSAGTQGSPLAIEPELGVFNEDAFRQLDYVIKSAGEHGIRLDLILVSQQDFYVGGREVFSHWRDGKSFYEEPVVSDFEQFIRKVLTRVNSYSGVAYKDDPAILAWETNNEITDSPIWWENRICSFIKKTDPNHLVINGNNLPIMAPIDERLSEPAADIYVAHYYEHWSMPWNLAAHAAAVAKAGKVFIVEEFGWDRSNCTVEDLKKHLAQVESNPDVAGDMFWALRAHIEPGKLFPVPGEGGEWWALYDDGRDTGENSAADMRERALVLESHIKSMTQSQM